jgi:hypothetical protein
MVHHAGKACLFLQPNEDVFSMKGLNMEREAQKVPELPCLYILYTDLLKSLGQGFCPHRHPPTFHSMGAFGLRNARQRGPTLCWPGQYAGPA